MDLNDSLYRTLRQLAELFKLDATSLYLFDEAELSLRRIAAVGYRSEYARSFPKVTVQPELLQHVKAVHATFLSAQGLPLPPIFRTVQQKEEITSPYFVILWSKDKVLGVLSVGTRDCARILSRRHQLAHRRRQPNLQRDRSHASLRRNANRLRQSSPDAGTTAAQRKNGSRRPIDFRRRSRTQQSAHRDSWLQPAAHREPRHRPAGNRIRRQALQAGTAHASHRPEPAQLRAAAQTGAHRRQHQSDPRGNAGAARLRSPDEKHPPASRTLGRFAGHRCRSASAPASFPEPGEQLGRCHPRIRQRRRSVGAHALFAANAWSWNSPTTAPASASRRKFSIPSTRQSPSAKARASASASATASSPNTAERFASKTCSLTAPHFRSSCRSSRRRKKDLSRPETPRARRVSAKYSWSIRTSLSWKQSSGILRARNHQVRPAASLTEAQQALREQEYDVVVADLHTYEGTRDLGLRAWLRIASAKPGAARHSHARHDASAVAQRRGARRSSDFAETLQGG